MLWWWPMTCKPIYKVPVHAPNGSKVNKSASEVYKAILFPNLCVHTNNLRYVSLKSKQFKILTPVRILNDLWPIILCNFKTKHRRFNKLYIFGVLMTRQTIWHYFQRNRSMSQFLTHMELSRSKTAILERAQNEAYQKNVVYALFTLFTKSHTFTRYCTIMPLSCAYLPYYQFPTLLSYDGLVRANGYQQ